VLTCPAPERETRGLMPHMKVRSPQPRSARSNLASMWARNWKSGARSRVIKISPRIEQGGPPGTCRRPPLQFAHDQEGAAQLPRRENHVRCRPVLFPVRLSNQHRLLSFWLIFLLQRNLFSPYVSLPSIMEKTVLFLK
jgi:hypothetical protein